MIHVVKSVGLWTAVFPLCFFFDYNHRWQWSAVHSVTTPTSDVTGTPVHHYTRWQVKPLEVSKDKTFREVKLLFKQISKQHFLWAFCRLCRIITDLSVYASCKSQTIAFFFYQPIRNIQYLYSQQAVIINVMCQCVYLHCTEAEIEVLETDTLKPGPIKPKWSGLIDEHEREVL